VPTISRPYNSWVFLKRHLFFRFCDLDIAAVFDPPLPLQCTSDLFFNHDVINVWLGVVNGERLTGAAKWADVIYEIDNQSVLYNLLHKLIDAYLKCFRQDAMKITLAVQYCSCSYRY
jgi:hypothetical protein